MRLRVIGKVLEGRWRGIGRVLAGHWQGIGRALAGHWPGIGRALAMVFGGHWPGIGGHWRALAGLSARERIGARVYMLVRMMSENLHFSYVNSHFRRGQVYLYAQEAEPENNSEPRAKSSRTENLYIMKKEEL